MFVFSICKGKHSAMLKKYWRSEWFWDGICECALEWRWLSICLYCSCCIEDRAVLWDCFVIFFKIPFLLPFKILTLFATLAGNFAHPWHTLCVLFNRMANVFMSSVCLPQHLGCYTQGCFVSFLLQLYRSSKPLLINYFRPFMRKGCVQLIFISAYS